MSLKKVAITDVKNIKNIVLKDSEVGGKQPDNLIVINMF